MYDFSVSEKHETRVLTPNSTTCYDIPTTDFCSAGLSLVLPQSFDSKNSCFCPIYNSSEGRKIFESCGCLKDFKVVPHFSENGSICFSDQNFSLNDTTVYFQCATDPCVLEDCFIITILSTYRIMISGMYTLHGKATQQACRYQLSHSHFIVPDDWAAISIHIPTGRNALNNTNYTLTCTVTPISGMNLPYTVEWVRPGGDVVVSEENWMVGEVELQGTVSTLNLTFIPFLFSDIGCYTCRAATIK